MRALNVRMVELPACKLTRAENVRARARPDQLGRTERGRIVGACKRKNCHDSCCLACWVSEMGIGRLGGVLLHVLED